MSLMFERKSPSNEPRPGEREPFDPYLEMFGVRMTLADLLDIRETEDYLIELEHISEGDRYPTPPYLEAEWRAYQQSKPVPDAN